MTKQSFVLDPNAQAYTDDEIVAKVNAASANITRSNAVESSAVDLSGKDTDDLAEGSGNKYDTGAPPATLEDLSDGSTRKAMSSTEKTKLSGIEDSATADLSAAEIRDLIVGLADTERKIVITDPSSGQYKVISVERQADGKLKISYDDVAV
jgi:hypothetical protein